MDVCFVQLGDLTRNLGIIGDEQLAIFCSNYPIKDQVTSYLFIL